MTPGVTSPRRYRLGSADHSAWLLGLGPAPCLVLGVSLLAGGVVLHSTHSVVLAVIPTAVGVLAVFGRWQGRVAYEWMEPLAGWMTLQAAHRDRWSARVPLLGRVAAGPDLPPFLDGLVLIKTDSRWAEPRVTGTAVVVDESRHRVTGALRVRGREFALLEPDEQNRVLDAWGAALAGFCRERSPVAQIAWSEWAAPASLEDHLTFVREQHDGSSSGPQLREYLDLVARAGPLATEHDVVVTLSVDRRRVRRSTDPVNDPAVEALLEELHRFSVRLEHAGLVVDPPLAPAELAGVLRLRADPSGASRLGVTAHANGTNVGHVSAHNQAPLAVAVAWRHVRVDQSWHRTFWIAEWPRLEAPADWLAGLLLHSGGVRTVTVVYEPVTPSRSRRAVDREATRLVSDEEERTARGFRIRAQHRRAETEVLARESELVSGFAELRFAGFVTVTAPDLVALDEQASDWEQVAAQSGLELRALDGQHDLGLCAGLSVGRVPTGRGRG
ncbi:MAG TPA: SCO6880 family protein [Acidimicrobiia bacterium]|nr:SCO6880 family protein [Acidimicrobiia bacterium]